MPREQGQKVVARNKKALHDYHIGERVEAGMVLTGTEVKSLRAGRASLVDAFATIDNGEVWLRNAHIPAELDADLARVSTRGERLPAVVQAFSGVEAPLK